MIINTNDCDKTAQQLKRILLVGLVNSGTTPIAKCFLQREDTVILSQVLKTSVEQTGRVILGEFYEHECIKSLLFNKETLGTESIARCTFPLFRADYLVDRANVFFFIFRHPVAIWHSWMNRRLETNRDHLVIAYNHLYSSYLNARSSSHQVKKLLFADMARGIKPLLTEMCDFCGVEFEDCMLIWNRKWGARRGGIRGNPDIDSYSTFSEDRIKKALILSTKTDDDAYIMGRLQVIWDKINQGA